MNIDEASQVSIAQAFPAILRGKQIVILGDTKQFSNVKSQTASNETNNLLFNQLKEAYGKYLSCVDVTKRDSLVHKVEAFNIKCSILEFMKFNANFSHNLRKHFRGYPELIGYSNKTFYENYLQVMKIRAKPIDEVLCFYQLHDIGQSELTRNTNTQEATYILSELERLREDGVQLSVGVITPFTNQQRFILNKLMESPNYNHYKEVFNIRVMTFDTCQGDERDIVYYSFVERPNENILTYIFIKDLGSIDDEDEGRLKAQRLNVGFSRAKERMVFVLSKSEEDIKGEIGKALRFYRRTLNGAKSLPSSQTCESPGEKMLLSILSQTHFYHENADQLEVVPQFPIGNYLNQLSVSTIPAYRVDFLITHRSSEGWVKSVVLEYDGFEYHFGDSEDVNRFNWDKLLVEQDIERQKTLESYGYEFIRVNKFVLGDEPIKYLDSRLQVVFGGKSTGTSQLEKHLKEEYHFQKNKERKCKGCENVYSVRQFSYKVLDGERQYSLECSACESETQKRQVKEIRMRQRAEREQVKAERSKFKNRTVSRRAGNNRLREALVSAMRSGSRVNVSYVNGMGEASSRAIKPIEWRSSNMISAYCFMRDKPLTFRLDRMALSDD